MQQHNLIRYNESNNGMGIEIQPFYVPERSLPAHKVYFYAYAITITNLSNDPVHLLRRYWIIKNGMGHEDRVEGEGVVGKQPRIMPKESFKYASFCPLQTPYGNMRGRYQLTGEHRGLFWVKVPVFFFRPPENMVQENRCLI